MSRMAALAETDREAPRWRKIVVSRWVLVPAIFGIAVLAWNIHVGRNNDGLVSGRVLRSDGGPAAGATVILLERSFINQVERARTIADAQGDFRFDNNRSHLIQLEAQLDGVGRSERRTVRLWYRAQNRVVDAPLVLAPRS